MDIEKGTVENIARAFWRRIEPYKDDYDRELPDKMPVEFLTHMNTALSILHEWQINPTAEELELAQVEANDYARLIDEARTALQEIYANNGEDDQIAALCSPLIDKLNIGL